MRISDWSSDVCSSDLASACGAKEAEAGRLLGRKRTPIKVSTLAMDRSRIESHIRPLIGRRKVAAIRLPDIEAMQHDIAAGKTAKPRGEGRGGVTRGGKGVAARSVRSEEHTSELQSLMRISSAVFCLKKKR